MSPAKLISILLAASAVDMASASTTLTADNVELTGSVQNGVVSYLGIPYAQPPSGEWRWRAPRPLPMGEPVRNLGHFGPSCAQPYIEAMADQNVDPEKTSEDCLYLNVWAPEDASDQPYPVMVWLHGGGFRIGGTGLELYNGEQLAREGVVVVTLNYRLGRLGFFAHPALQQEDEATGNFGLLDQIQALRFVRKHIGTLGGDPGNITLFGESAGGASVLYLMAAKQARGLFDKAIVQSGAIDMPELSRAEMAELASVFADNAGVAEASAEQLRALPLETVLATLPQGKTDTMPFIDGRLIEQSVYQAFERGEVAPVPLLIGSNDYEAGFFPPGFSLRVPDIMGPELWRQAQAYADGYAQASGVEAENDGHDTYAQAAQVATDLFVTLGTRRVARAHAARGKPTYRYEFTYVPPGERNETLGAIHTADINYVFGNNLADDADTQAMGRELRKRWVAFAKSGKPNDDDQPTWPTYGQDDETLLHFTPQGTRMGAESNAARLNFLESLGSLQIN
ncbi:carboxylesterase family protein [Halomonas sp. SpR1]|uniref:carboxylesterase/lipase family protein n=1 Tax=Halomonas sp. SpR1 TaxID=3050462 RepID=UPI0027E437C5|nr:carboxylesterase family protein [Halomonas sp. SpR1]MDQ7732387.1 carboxylesterase family protein [Halomonas sp. SpR1]